MTSEGSVPIIGDLGAKPKLGRGADLLVGVRGTAFSIVCKILSNSMTEFVA